MQAVLPLTPCLIAPPPPPLLGGVKSSSTSHVVLEARRASQCHHPYFKRTAVPCSTTTTTIHPPRAASSPWQRPRCPGNVATGAACARAAPASHAPPAVPWLFALVGCSAPLLHTRVQRPHHPLHLRCRGCLFCTLIPHAGALAAPAPPTPPVVPWSSVLVNCAAT